MFDGVRAGPNAVAPDDLIQTSPTRRTIVVKLAY